MGVEPYLVVSSVIGVLAQRLVRTVCEECREEYTPPQKSLKDFGESETSSKQPKLYRGKGCPKCMNTGYKGRIGIFELMILDDKIRNLIMTRAPAEEIRGAARSAGMIGLKEDGVQKVRQGLTTIEEVLRVTQEE